MGLSERRILKDIAIPQYNIPGFGTKRSSSDLSSEVDEKKESSRSDRNHRMKKKREEQVFLL